MHTSIADQLPSWETLTATIDALDRYVATLYVKSESNILVNDARYQLHVQSASDNLGNLPPSRNGLKEHVKRSAFLAGWFWGNTLSTRLPPSKFEWGWKQLPGVEDILYSGPAHCRYQRSPSLKLCRRVDASLRVLNAVSVNVVLTKWNACCTACVKEVSWAKEVIFWKFFGIWTLWSNNV